MTDITKWLVKSLAQTMALWKRFSYAGYVSWVGCKKASISICLSREYMVPCKNYILLNYGKS